MKKIFVLIILLCVPFDRIWAAKPKQGPKQKTPQFEKLPFHPDRCPPGSRRRNDAANEPTLRVSGIIRPDGSVAAPLDCVGVKTNDVFSAMKWLAFPGGSNPEGVRTLSPKCTRTLLVQGFTVCLDELQFTKSVETDSSIPRVALNDPGVGIGEAYPDYVANTLTSKTCVVWSLVASQFCDDLGTLEFEREMAQRGCVVELFHYLMYHDGVRCKPKKKIDIEATHKFWNDGFEGRLHVHRIIVWERRCYACLYKKVMDLLDGLNSQRYSHAVGKGKKFIVDILKIQSRLNPKLPLNATSVSSGTSIKSATHSSKYSGSELYADVYDGIQYVVLSDLYLYVPYFLRDHVGQVVVTFPFTTDSLIDGPGREAENGYNMWATAQMLRQVPFQPLVSRVRSLYGLGGEGVPRTGDRPHPLAPVLLQDQISPRIGVDVHRQHFFQHSFINAREQQSQPMSEAVKTADTRQKHIDYLVQTRIERIQSTLLEEDLPVFTLPKYCRIPSWAGNGAGVEAATREVRMHIAQAERARCHPQRLWLACDHTRTYDPFLPCPQQLHDALAYDYAVSQGWCDFLARDARIEPLRTVTSIVNADGIELDAAIDTSKINIPLGNIEHNKAPKLRLVFFFTVYADAPFVVRQLARLYSPYHFYLLHVDPKGSSPEFEKNLKALIVERILRRSATPVEAAARTTLVGNIAIAKDVPIVYGASTASILLSRAMAWALDNERSISAAVDSTVKAYFHPEQKSPRERPGWDYFVPLTGSDYPLVTLNTMIDILAASYSTELIPDDAAPAVQEETDPSGGWFIPKSQAARQSARKVEAGYQPFLMAWDKGSSDHIRQLQLAHPNIYQQDDDVRLSLEITWTERGDKSAMGSNAMETRAYSYAPTLACYGAYTFYRLDTRLARNDSQWLFPRAGSIVGGRARVVTRLASPGFVPEALGQGRLRKSRNFDSTHGPSYSNVDGKHRAWRKSDPGTSGAYDFRSVRHIIDSEEGRKYYHFFKHMLLGSEEHYYITMLYNWPRTRKFVTSLSAQAVWNTWQFGTWEASMGGFKTHTHFLSEANLPLLRGLSKRGVLFARKLSEKKTPIVLDALDAFIDGAKSLQGKYWPGFFAVGEDITM